MRGYPQDSLSIKAYLLYNINTMITASTNVFGVSKGSFFNSPLLKECL